MVAIISLPSSTVVKEAEVEPAAELEEEVEPAVEPVAETSVELEAEVLPPEQAAKDMVMPNARPIASSL